jgi:hypothetical protein
VQIRRPGPVLRVVWAAFLLVLMAGFAMVIGHVALAAVVTVVGALGFVVTGVVIFATTPRTGR